MPLSKERNKERMRQARLVQPESEALQSKSRAVEETLNTTAPVQPSSPVVQPIIDAVSPSIKREGYSKASSTVVQPEPLPNCPDGRYRSKGVK